MVRPLKVDLNPRAEVKLRVPFKTINLVKEIVLSGKYRSAFLNDFCMDAITEKLDKFIKDNKLDLKIIKERKTNGQPSSGS